MVSLLTYPLGCHTSVECGPRSLCVRSRCKVVIADADASDHGSLPDSCFLPWPTVQNCAEWSEAGMMRVVESNNVPPFFVPPYCPFGLGQGYCQSPSQGNSTDCPPFAGRVCPCVNNTGFSDPPPGPGNGTTCPAANPASGDVLMPVYQRFEIPLHPDPTDVAKPLHMYNNSVLKTGNTYQVIGVLLNGVQLKGPAEANGFNVDTSLIPLPCGGHVTPPVGPGPVYHHHKAPDCLDGISQPGTHGPLLGYAADGFGIYGFGDFTGTPVLDQCNGQFGPVPGSNGEVVYHYHAMGVTNEAGKPHRPYFMGCLGPSKGRCNSTVSPEYDGGANWCGQGCGADICVQPGTDRDALTIYLDGFTGGRGAAWLAQYSVNAF